MTRLMLLAATMLAAAWSTGSARAQPVSGIYIGAGGGANFMQDQTSTSVTRGTINGLPATQAGNVRRSFDTGVVGVGSVGYGFGNGLRTEIEGDYRNNRRREPNGTALLSAGGSERKYGGMVNVLFDLDIGSPYVFPYFGGGVGYQNVDYRFATRNVLLGNTLTSARASEGNFAYQGIGGIAFPVPYVPGLSITAEYRFLGLAGTRNVADSSTASSPLTSLSGHDRAKSDYNHSLMLGVRYEFNPPPPPGIAAPPAPLPVISRAYIVFFDWDRADLTDRARGIIAQAAQASTQSGTTRIEVDGNADRSGSPRYNIGLSQRRAQAVASELMRDGITQGAITIQAFGDTRPLVPTAAGVREPQNRRVEIVLR